MKKLRDLLLVLALGVSIVGCGGDKKPDAAKVEKRVFKVSTKFVDDEQTVKSLTKVVDKVKQV